MSECFECVYFYPFDKRGECRRYPPQAILEEFAWPVVKGFDCCGEFMGGEFMEHYDAK